MKKVILVLGCMVLLGMGSQSFADLGDTDADLVYTPITPCRIIDTRSGSMITASPTNFVVGGTAGFEAQGGQAGGCGIPLDATAVTVNFIAVGALGPGNLRAWPFGIPEPTYCSIINYAAVTGLNIANGMVEPICDSSVTTCTSHLMVRANGQSAHLVADVTGYFRAFPSDELHNPLRVALLRGYKANTAGISFPVGYGPRMAAFDGANIWTANEDGTVTKIRANDGANLGMFYVTGSARGIAFDGANIWVADSSNNKVIKVRASDGATLTNFNAGTTPVGVTFDGANIWVVNHGDNTVTKLRASDGSLQGTFNVGTGPYFAAFDGTNIWVTNYGISTAGNTVTKLRASDGVNLGTFDVGNSPRGIAYDGSNIWVANGSNNTVTKLRARDGANLGTFAPGNAPSTSPYGVVFDGANIWVVNFGVNGAVSKL